MISLLRRICVIRLLFIRIKGILREGSVSFIVLCGNQVSEIIELKNVLRSVVVGNNGFIITIRKGQLSAQHVCSGTVITFFYGQYPVGLIGGSGCVESKEKLIIHDNKNKVNETINQLLINIEDDYDLTFNKKSFNLNPYTDNDNVKRDINRTNETHSKIVNSVNKYMKKYYNTDSYEDVGLNYIKERLSTKYKRGLKIRYDKNDNKNYYIMFTEDENESFIPMNFTDYYINTKSITQYSD